MNQSAAKKTSKMVIVLNKIKTYFSKPQNIILLLFGIVLTFTTVAPIVAIVEDTFKIHPGTIDAHLTGKASGYSVANYVDGENKSVDTAVKYRASGSLYLPDLHFVRRFVRILNYEN